VIVGDFGHATAALEILISRMSDKTYKIRSSQRR
jgi:hypothetical protein